MPMRSLRWLVHPLGNRSKIANPETEMPYESVRPPNRFRDENGGGGTGSFPESRPNVDVRRVDELGKRCRINRTTRPKLHVAPALARSFQQAPGPSAMRQRRSRH